MAAKRRKGGRWRAVNVELSPEDDALLERLLAHLGVRNRTHVMREALRHYAKRQLGAT